MSRKGRLAGVLAGRCKGSESFSRGQTSFLPLKPLHDLDHINTWKGRGGQRQERERETESETWCRRENKEEGKSRHNTSSDDRREAVQLYSSGGLRVQR